MFESECSIGSNRDQDDQLDDLSRVVTSTKHVAVAIHDELELQHRLLDDLDDEASVFPFP